MSVELSHFEKLSIFWEESAIYLLVYAAYALLVCAVVLIIEVKLQRSAGTVLSRLVLYNGLLAIVAVVLFTLSLLVSGWYAKLLGGELGAFVVCVTVTLLALYFFRAHAIEQLSLGYRSAGVACGVAAVVLAAPYALGTLFILLLGAGMRN